MSAFGYLARLPEAASHFVVVRIPTLVTGRMEAPAMGIVRDAYIEVFHGRIGEVARMGEMSSRVRRALHNGSAVQVSGEERIVTPGLLQGHTHLCQTLWRGQGEGKELLPWLRDHTWPGEAALSPREIAIAAHFGAAEVLTHGATTVLDMGTVHHTKAYVRDGILPTGLRAWTGNVVMDYMDPEVPFPSRLLEPPAVALQKTQTVMEYLHFLALRHDRRINPAVSMRFLVTSHAETARALATLAHERDWVLQTHASENLGEIEAVRRRFGLDNVAALGSLGFLGPRTFLHHVVHLSPEEIRMMAETGCTGVHCPGSNGMLGSGIAPLADLLEAGVRMAIGSDGAPCNDMLNIRADLWAARVLAGASQRAATAVSPEALFRMATTGGAAGLGMEGEIGRIERGFRADLVFWNANAWGNFVDLDRPRDVIGRLVRTTDRATDVFIDGQQVVSNGEPLFIGDRTLFRREVNQAARRVARRAWGFRVEIPLLRR